MNKPRFWAVTLVVIGLLVMLAGAIDPLEGCFVILVGSAAVVGGTFLAKSRYRLLLSLAFALIATGVVAMVILTAIGGIGGRSSRSLWWGLFILPYPVGWIIGLIGAILRLIESFKQT